MKSKKEVVFRIPGGWYGADPGSITNSLDEGHVVVDPKRIVDAVGWLKRRRYSIVGTHATKNTHDSGIHITYLAH